MGTRTRKIGALGATAALAASAWGIAAIGTASADPTGSRNSLTFPAHCSDGSTVKDLVVTVNSANGQGQGTNQNPKGQGNFVPAHVAGSNQLFHPTAFDLSFTFETQDGTVNFQDTQVKPNGPTPVSCAIDFTSDDGTFSFSGTVLGYYSGKA